MFRIAGAACWWWRTTLTAAGWQVDTAENGRLALERVLAHPPNLILLDLMMPEMDGFAFIARLRETPAGATIPILVVTAKELTAEERGRLNGEVIRILRKGAFRTEDLVADVGRWLARHAARRSSHA
jgi:adenylate cyclase